MKFGGPQVLFRADGPATVWAMFKHYLVLPFTSPINGVMLVGVGLLCTWLFKDMLWHRMNRFMGKGPGNRLLAAVVLAFCLMPLLALFPDTPIALLQDGHACSTCCPMRWSACWGLAHAGAAFAAAGPGVQPRAQRAGHRCAAAAHELRRVRGQGQGVYLSYTSRIRNSWLSLIGSRRLDAAGSACSRSRS
ncbi:hypothetical protein NWF32_29790 [Pseudomonas qingdaonensis]|nr:hypothetical protein [Pseudomonas qingdaonensis]